MLVSGFLMLDILMLSGALGKSAFNHTINLAIYSIHGNAQTMRDMYPNVRLQATDPWAQYTRIDP